MAAEFNVGNKHLSFQRCVPEASLRAKSAAATSEGTQLGDHLRGSFFLIDPYCSMAEYGILGRHSFWIQIPGPKEEVDKTKPCRCGLYPG